MFNKIKVVQELRNQANTIKKALETEIVEGQGGWGKVKIKMDGNQDCKAVEISDDLVGDKSKLEAATREAINDTVKKVQRVMANKMSSMGGLNLPGLK